MADGSIQGGVVSISFDGAPLASDMAAAVVSTIVELRLNAPASCSIEINPVDYDAQSYRVMDLEGVDLGTKLTVRMGLDESAPVFSGTVAAIEPNLTKTCRELEITGYDSLYQLQFGTNIRTFLEMSDSMIVTQVIEEADLIALADDTPATYPYVLQNNVSDFRFVISRARRLGYEVEASGDTIVFRATKAGQAATVSLEYAVGMTSFRARMKALTQGSSVTRTGWDPQTKSLITATVDSATPEDLMEGSESGYDASENIASSANTAPDGSITDTEIAKALATGAFQNDLDGFMVGIAECAGNPAIVPGINVELSNVGEKFDGLYYVIAARHSYDIADGYQTRFEVRRTGI